MASLATLSRGACMVLSSILSTGMLFAGQDLPPLGFGRVSVEDPSVTLGKYQPLVSALGNRLGRQVNLVQARSYTDMLELFRNGDVQMGIMNAYSFTQMGADPHVLAVARRVIGKDSSYRTYIVTRKDSGLSSLKDLKGKSFAFSESHSTTGFLLPRLLMKQKGLIPERDFSKTLVITQHDSLLLAVANRSVDAAAVASYVFESYDRQVTDKMRILDKSQSIPYGPIVVRRNLGPDLIRQIQAFFLTLDHTEEGRRILQEAGLSGFVPAHTKDYDIVRRLSTQLDSPDSTP